MKKIIIYLLLVISFAACRKDKDIENNEKIDFPTETYVNTTVKGIVFDSRGLPLEGVKVKVGSFSVLTDINGYFIMQDIKANKNGAVITASKSGYVTQAKSFYPQLNAASYFRFSLYYNKNSIIVDSDNDNKNFGSVYANIKINNNAFVVNGNTYKGKLVINPFWTTLSDKNFKEKMFFAPVGYDKYFKIKGLKSYGMIGLGLLDGEGKEKVELGEGNYLVLKLKFFDIASLPPLPEKVPVWYFDMEKGVWIEKYTAILDDDKTNYIVEVDKTGYYNFATPFDVKRTQFSLQSQNGVKLPFVRSRIYDDNKHYFLKMRSNSEGEFICYLPEDKDVIAVFSVNGKNVQKKVNSDIAEVKVEEKINIVKFDAAFSDCDDAAVKNGYVTVITNTDSVFYLLDSEGKVDRDIVLGEDVTSIKWFATDLDKKVNTGVHRTYIEDGKASVLRPFICPEPYLIFRFGEERALLNLTSQDITTATLFLKYKDEKYDIELGYIEFHGKGKYDNWDYTIQLDSNFNMRIVPDLKYEQLNEVLEYDKDGMVRGHLKGRAILKNLVTSEVLKEADLEIDYSAKVR